MGAASASRSHREAGRFGDEEAGGCGSAGLGKYAGSVGQRDPEGLGDVAAAEGREGGDVSLECALDVLAKVDHARARGCAW